MKYRPALPEDNDNISRTHPLKEFGLLVTGLMVIFSLVYYLLGFGVDLVANSISHQTEASLFRLFSSHFTFLQDKKSENERQKMQTMVDDLQKCTSLPYPVEVHMVASEEANAIALPGGHVVVFSGLLEAVPDDAGLAFVLAHELSHFHNRDHLHALGRGLVLYFLSTLLAGGDSSISKLLAPSAGLSSAHYSQDREVAADRGAVDILHCYAGTFVGATKFFKFMIETEKGTDVSLFHYFSSHPQTEERLILLKQYAMERGYRMD